MPRSKLPIIDVQAQAVDADRAAALANAAAKGLGEYLDSKAAAEAVRVRVGCASAPWARRPRRLCRTGPAG